MNRGTGGNRFIPGDADRDDLLFAVERGLQDLERFAADTGRTLDLGEISVGTKRTKTGGISVTVSADLAGGAS